MVSLVTSDRPKVFTRSLKVPIIVNGKPLSFTTFPTASSADP